MTGTSRSRAATLNRETMLAWDLIPDERAPFKAIIMRFASYEAARTALTDVGFSPTSSSVHALDFTTGEPP